MIVLQDARIEIKEIIEIVDCGSPYELMINLVDQDEYVILHSMAREKCKNILLNFRKGLSTQFFSYH